MNIVFGFAGQDADQNFQLLKAAVDHNVQSDLPLNICISRDGNCIFALLQPGGFYPLEEPFYDSRNQYLCMLQGYFWYGAPFPFNTEQAKRSLILAGHHLLKEKKIDLSEEDGGLFNYFLYDEKSRGLFISSDLSGIFPLYYTKNSKGIYFSSHIRVLAKALGMDYDPISVLQQMAFHYTVGRRTIFKDIWRLNAGETLNCAIDMKRLSFEQSSEIYSTVTSYKNDNEAVEAMFMDYSRGVQELCRKKLKRGIMLSGGFDTRLVAFGYHQQQQPIVGLTLGDVDNFEVKIAQKLTKNLRSEHKIYSPEPDVHLSYDRILHLINTVENINFAYCDSGGSLLKRMGAETISTGYGGETFFGGQGYSFYGKTLNNKARLKLALRRSLGFPIQFFDNVDDDNVGYIQRTILDYHRKQIKSKQSWFLPQFNQEFMVELEESVLNDINQELNRFYFNAPATIQQVFERFWLEHHVLKEFGKQEWVLSSHVPLVLPTLHHSFYRRCSNLSPDRKIDHGIYIKFIKKYFGNLAHLPTSNVPLPISFPTPLLWISRGVRAQHDQRQVRNQFVSKGLSNSRRFGWSNFEDWFRRGDFLNRAGEYIEPTVFSQEFVEKKLQRWINWEERIYSGQDLLTMITISQLIK